MSTTAETSIVVSGMLAGYQGRLHRQIPLRVTETRIKASDATQVLPAEAMRINVNKDAETIGDVPSILEQLKFWTDPLENAQREVAKRIARNGSPVRELEMWTRTQDLLGEVLSRHKCLETILRGVLLSQCFGAKVRSRDFVEKPSTIEEIFVTWRSIQQLKIEAIELTKAIWASVVSSGDPMSGAHVKMFWGFDREYRGLEIAVLP